MQHKNSWINALNTIQQARIGFLLITVLALGMLVQWMFIDAVLGPTWSFAPGVILIAVAWLGRRILG